MANAKKTSSRRYPKTNAAKLKPQDCTLGLSVVHPKAAGIDVGNGEHYVAVPPQLDEEPVRRYGCFTRDLVALAEWLQKCGIETVAMQSTGVYWITLYDILEERGMKVFLVNARDTKNVPGRKTDVQECQWLLKLHVYGLLRNSFRPPEEIRVMRTLWRQRQQHIADAARCVQRMQKALTQMNVQLANVISDICGKTGRAILRAILAGERDAKKLARLRDPGIKASQEMIARSLEGNWREELLFVLRQEFQLYGQFHKMADECDQELERHFHTLEAKADPTTLEELTRNKRPRGHVPENMDLRAELYRLTGKDLTKIESINVLTAQTVIAEVGYEVSRWPTEDHFVSWLNLAPRNKISGGKVVGRDGRKVVNRAGQALRQAVTSLLHSNSYLGAQYRRLRAKLGPVKAAKAMAAKVARLIYRMLKYGEEFVSKGAAVYEEKYRQQQIKTVMKKATELGLTVMVSTPAQV
ncbi:MAG: IS110 family transposase [Bryobacteraceae bacterium]